MSDKFSNRLIHETSPYLLQHAHNPVDWYPWGVEALQKAIEENRMILVSIGYSACHWCHVMERESFENESVAALMNAHFINIKIDREERPDLDHIYMDAVQAISGSGGWPLNVFLTPDAKPVYGGTYFPPERAFNRPSWTEVLTQLAEAWKTREEDIRNQAAELTGHLSRSNLFGQLTKADGEKEEPGFFVKEEFDAIFQQIMKGADTKWGGFGRAPKFPQTFVIDFLFRYHYFTGNQAALQQALLSVDKMLEGGIYDQLGGGLARYSTDDMWLAPHFEKMLYDNALLVNVLCDAYQVTGQRNYEKAIRKTIDFVERELRSPAGGFYAALDADSEGEEGKYYVWEKKEVGELLGGDANVFCAFFDITEEGNWSHNSLTPRKNILRVLKKIEIFAAEKKILPDQLENMLECCIGKLLNARSRRIRPQLDDKILLNWNALMVTALARASAALCDDRYRELAEISFQFLLDNFLVDKEGMRLQHISGNGDRKSPAFLDDYACLIQSCIALQELSSDTRYLDHASKLTRRVIADFSDNQTGLFYFTSADQRDIIMRKKEVYDGATASGNSMMAENLFYLSLVLDVPVWRQLAMENTRSLKKAIASYPASFSCWASTAMKQVFGRNEIVIMGPGCIQIRKDLLKYFLPAKIVQCSERPEPNFPLLAGKTIGSEPLIYLCKAYSCQNPVKTLNELFFVLNSEEIK